MEDTIVCIYHDLEIEYGDVCEACWHNYCLINTPAWKD